jgi:hypothetical protein
VAIHDELDLDEPVVPSASRLWTGGIATAVVAAMVVVAGVYICRGVLGIPVLAPSGAGSLGNSSTAVYAGLAAASALLCTGLLHLLLLEVPRPITFFIWITVLADIIVAAAPFTQPASTDSKVFTADTQRAGRGAGARPAAPVTPGLPGPLRAGPALISR